MTSGQTTPGPHPEVHPRARVALETTLLAHGVPKGEGLPLAARLASIVRVQGALPQVVGMVDGQPIVGMTDAQLTAMLAAPSSEVRKVNTANLGTIMHRRGFGATTVSTTMELAAGAGVSVFATGGIGGVHPMDAAALRLDISADLLAFTRFPVAVVTSGVKSILDVASTREMLETLGVPVIGWKCDAFPAFYLREAQGGVGRVDARFDDMRDLATFVRHELSRTRRGIVICNPIPAAHELPRSDWFRWLSEAERRAAQAGACGRDATPALLAALHEVSGGATLRANIALVESNAHVAAMLARAMVD